VEHGSLVSVVMNRPHRGERGSIIAAAGIGLAAFLALTVVAIDLGRLGFTATEVQTVADIAATAGATALINNGGNGGAAVAQAQSVVALNQVNGSTASISAGDVIVGRYESGAFTPGGAPANAVRANASATVNNLLASILGTPTTTVQKTATAVFSSVGSAVPEIPIAIGSCYFENLCSTCLPPLVQVPSNSSGDANNSAWTGFFAGSNAMTIRSYIPAPCGGGVTPPLIQVGDRINLNNGQIANLYDDFQCLLNNNMDTFVVPVIQSSGSTCGGPINQSQPVVGFVTLQIDSVNGMGNPKYINLSGVWNASVPGRPGGLTNTGSGMAILVD